MSTNLRQPLPLPLPSSAIPDGCLPWDAEQTRRWTEALPPWWVPLRLRARYVQLLLLVAAAVALSLALTDLPPYLPALVALHLVWVLLRPEAVRVSAPALVLAVAALDWGSSWAVMLGGVLLAGVCARIAELRLRARVRQREAALAAAGDVTATLPDVGRPLGRGYVLGMLGLFVIVAGAVLVVTAGLWSAAEDRQGVPAAGCFVAGIGATLLLSGVLGRRRAIALRAAPAPVLRVLVREAENADAEVFAADDVAALRPLFTVATVEPGDDSDDEDDEDDVDDDEAELDALLDRLADEEPGPLREAVLYGTPYDGAEVLIVSAAPKPDQPLVVERSTGPVRPLSERGVRWRLAREKRAAARIAADDARHLGLVEAVRAATETVPVRQWRAGKLDWLATVLLVQWGVALCWAGFTDNGISLWKQILIVLVGLVGAARVPVKLCWRITADRTGLWLRGLLGATHIPWEDFRGARRESFELKLRWRGGESWAVAAPHSARFQRRRGLTHPHDALAAELTALHTDPALRPTGDSEEAGRGRPLWPLAVVFAVVWLTALATSRMWL